MPEVDKYGVYGGLFKGKYLSLWFYSKRKFYVGYGSFHPFYIPKRAIKKHKGKYAIKDQRLEGKVKIDGQSFKVISKERINLKSINLIWNPPHQQQYEDKILLEYYRRPEYFSLRNGPYKMHRYDQYIRLAIEEHLSRFFKISGKVLHETRPSFSVQTMMATTGKKNIHVDIHVCEPDRENDFYMYVTNGMSSYPMAGVSPCIQRAEVIFKLPTDWKVESNVPESTWPVARIQEIAKYPYMYDTWFQHGHTWAGESIPGLNISASIMFPGTKFVGVLFRKPIAHPNFAKMHFRDGSIINFYSIVPIYQDELEFCYNFGTAPFIKAMDIIGIDDVVDVNRENLVPDIIQNKDLLKEIGLIHVEPFKEIDKLLTFADIAEDQGDYFTFIKRLKDLGELYLHMKALNPAVNTLKKALQLSTHLSNGMFVVEIAILFSHALIKSGIFVLALETVDAAMNLIGYGDKDMSRHKKHLILIRDNLLRLVPSDIAAQFAPQVSFKGEPIQKGLDLLSVGQYDKALQLLENSRSQGTDGKMFCLIAGSCYNKLGRYEEMRNEYEKCLVFCAEPRVFTGLGEANLHLGDEQTAREYFQQAFEAIDRIVNPNPADRAWIMYRLGLYDDTIQYSDNQIGSGLHKTAYHLYHTKGVCYRALGNYEEAESNFKKALELNKKHTDSLYDLGVLYKKMGKTEDAIMMLERAVKADPKWSEVRETLKDLKPDSEVLSKRPLSTNEEEERLTFHLGLSSTRSAKYDTSLLLPPIIETEPKIVTPDEWLKSLHEFIINSLEDEKMRIIYDEESLWDNIAEVKTVLTSYMDGEIGFPEAMMDKNLVLYLWIMNNHD